MFLKGLNALGLNLAQRNFPIFTENYLVMWELVKHGLGLASWMETSGTQNRWFDGPFRSSSRSYFQSGLSPIER